MLEQPVKEAVREAVAEKLDSNQAMAERRSSEASDGTGALPVAAIIAGLAAPVVVAYLLRERSGDDSYPDDVDEATAAGDRVETEAPVESDA